MKLFESGSFKTSSFVATAHYEFDNNDGTVQLDIIHQWMDEKDIEELIEFLKAVKEHLK